MREPPETSDLCGLPSVWGSTRQGVLQLVTLARPETTSELEFLPEGPVYSARKPLKELLRGHPLAERPVARESNLDLSQRVHVQGDP